MPRDVSFQVVINGTVHSADLETLRQWVREGRVGPGTVVTRDDGPPFPLRHLAELKADLQSSIPGPTSSLRMPESAPTAAPPPPVVSLPPVAEPVNLSAPPFSAALQPKAEPRTSEPERASQKESPNERHRTDPRYISAMRSIRAASWTGTILSIPALLFGLYALTIPAAALPPTPEGIHPGVLILGLGGLLLLLSQGLHRGSRLCGVLLLLWYFAGFFFNLFINTNLVGSVVLALMTLLFFGGLIGAMELHQFRREVGRGKL